jgi:dihydroorotase
VIRKLTINPAQLLGIPKGTLRPGVDADVTIIDPETRWTIDPAAFLSKSRNTPYGGWEVRGRAHTVIVNGEVRHTLGGIVQHPVAPSRV